jgi:hypothetical protein
MNNVRSRLVNFRVTDEEFQRLKAASGNHGARCLSEFARSVMLGTFNSRPVDDNSFHDELLAYGDRLSVLEQNMARLMDAFVSRKSVSMSSDD